MASGSNANAVTAGPWANLPQELCDAILDCSDVVSIIRFPAVCADWAAASKKDHGPRLPSGTPTLLTSSLDPEGYDVEYNVEPGAFGLHDVATGKSYHGEAEGLKNRTWVGGKDDWLVTTDLKCSVELLNPITGARVPLPSFETMPGVEVVEVSDRGPGVSFKKSRHGAPPSFFRSPSHRLLKVTLCRTPAHTSGYLAVALFFSSRDSTGGLVAFTAAGDERWTPLKNPEGLHYSLNKYTDVTVHKGRVLAVATSGGIWSWDMNGGAASEPTILSPPDFNGDDYCTRRVFYLATSSDGGLQRICMFGDNDVGVKEERWWRIAFDFQWSIWPTRVLLHELDAITGAWRRVRGLGGGRALFVGANYPFYADVSRGGSGDPLFREDCVYVADLINCDAGIFDLKMGDDSEYNWDWDSRLWYPAISDPLQMPMWFRPTAAYPRA